MATQKRSESTRAGLLESAAKLFSDRGFDATSVDDICSQANVSKGAFYHHFESKQAIFLSLLKSWLQTVDYGLAQLRQSTAPQTLVSMTEILPAILATAKDQLPMFLEFWLQASRDEQVWEASIQPYQHFRDYFADIISKGMTEGSLKKADPQVAGQVILALAVGILLQALLEPQGADWEKTAKQGMEILMKGLAI